ncbi:MAG: phosphoglucosamine mutase [Candidatus Omnitrophota bacterium]|nr:MAG: phosphoglucosamine mutase [Candidatus Omnitrophota bacterium]
MNNHKLFGTDGIRAEFGQWPLTVKMIYYISFAVGKWLKNDFKTKKSFNVVIGRDTRQSGEVIEEYLSLGLLEHKIRVVTAGVVPTPCVAFLTNKLKFDLGIVISASHNPAVDNGIKFFKNNGFKLSELEEQQIEKLIFGLLKSKTKINLPRKRNLKLEQISSKGYFDHLKLCVRGLNLENVKIVADCANGAVSHYAGKLFSDLGAKVSVLHNHPDGVNINYLCGSLYPDNLIKQVKKTGSNIGFSFDGDGDRVIFSDEKACVLDGDHIMALVSKYLLSKNKLDGKKVVGTSMTNLGLERFLDGLKIKLVRAGVGDKFVLNEMIRHKAIFGGEQSGHIIFLNYATTGDGLLTALQILKIMQDEQLPVSRLISGLKKYPQLICNLKIKEKKDFKQMPGVWKKIKQVEKALGTDGRLVMRYSGTEKLVRIMVEGSSKAKIEKLAYLIKDEIKKEIGI